MKIGENRLTGDDLKSRAMLTRLRTLHQTDPEFWKELSGEEPVQPQGSEPDPERLDSDDLADDDADDTQVPTAQLINRILGHPCDSAWTADERGRLQADTLAESDDPDHVFAGLANSTPAIDPARDNADGVDIDMSDPVGTEKEDNNMHGERSGVPPAVTRRPTRARKPAGWYNELDDLPL